ncbi:solute carrier family 22 member 1-like [Trichoplusia ni]|uniref:Solute carrier family 22 member 1-like n=1 Tax=Trichoplusia ni TaxID=7111 RepID=A0A7E5WX72_TRINI|nr:solute carrier family 22 member 1-like [Trichoplusia ni]
MKSDEDPQKLEVNDINGVTKDDKMALNKSNKDANNSDDKTKSEEEAVDLESILGEFKIYGWYHIKCVTLIGFLVFTNGWHGTNYVFVAENVDYTCKYPTCNSLELNNLLLNTTLDLKCRKYEIRDRNASCIEDNFDISHSVHCDEWVYKNNDSFVAELNLGCEDWKRTLIGTMHSTGYMLGLFLVGPSSDKFGRKSVVVFTTLACAVIGMIKSATYSYWVYAFVEMIEPILGDCYSATFTLAMEMVTKEYRPLMLFAIGIFGTLGDVSMATIAWLSPNWRMFLIYTYIPQFIFILYIFWMDESPRWLLSKGKKTEAENILRQAAKMNRIVIDENKLSKLRCEENSGNSSLLCLLKITFNSKKLFLRLLCCICMWFTGLFNSYSLSINSVSLQGNKYVNYAMTNATGIPGSFLVYFLLSKCHRKKPLMFSFLLTTVFCIAHSFLPSGYTSLSIFLYVGGKFSAFISIRIIYIYTSELFPTYTRNTMHALCSALGRTGAILAPQTPLLMYYWPGLPSLVIGILSLLTAAVITLLPDTSNDVLPDNIQQAETIGEKESDLCSKL